jgi:hypothetical protein
MNALNPFYDCEFDYSKGYLTVKCTKCNNFELRFDFTLNNGVVSSIRSCFPLSLAHISEKHTIEEVERLNTLV